ncbi:YihY/virulence factor BrkB family protein [Chitinophaga sancti]|uniref:Membrane protein n=1 Tax=Chitinophaga sancti TaxID=1004 RepID=A0A1K1NT32_9BACT|nr:YihY/virulence factor BrkB family protein [Chitinophaga sancti]WQD60158.1 YihY/virulence factor BrkB family protein [Chitinophaga sancti]WQG87714.1 YihY/virulence factor BrkB family protein [Chitinophaga sancti]SFW38397.1 membrane protein [Chitinophaga sancti]
MQKPGFFKKYWKILKQTFSDFMDDKVLKLSAALSYYTIFSIAPMLIVIITLCEVFLGKDAIEGSIYGQINSFVGNDAALQIQQMIKNAALSGDSTWATVGGIVTLIFGATGVFGEIQDSINFIWQLKAKPKNGILKIVINRLLSFSMVISLGFILLVSLALNGLIELFSTQLARLLPEVTVVLVYVINLVLTFTIISLLFAIIFKVLPDARVKWKHVIVGAMTTAVLFMVGKFAIGFYLGASKVGTTYGAAGSIVIILLWVYYSAIILYFGAEFTQVHVQYHGEQIRPNDYAVYYKEVPVELETNLAAAEKKPPTP